MNSWELDLLHQINHEWTSHLLDWLMPALSAIDAWVPLLALAAILTAIRGGRRARLMLLCAAFAVAIADGVVCKSLKSAVGRTRPRDAMAGVVIRDLAPGRPAAARLFKQPVVTISAAPEDGRVPGKSFPSSHTANMFAVATVIALSFRAWGIVAFVIAAGVAWSRIYVGAHWPGDIPPSIGIGILTGWLVTQAVAKVSARVTPRAPRSAGDTG
ncbi:MAG: phosphatase PAP2 family protein [Verrucomicrobiaceae bacterium]|nr:phosphatase PAP2 family protein [Verrucomicrobiaceae bacterium]